MPMLSRQVRRARVIVFKFAGTRRWRIEMSRQPKELAALGLKPLRQYWQEINRYERQEKAAKQGRQKTYDKRRPKCRCEAYRFPHRPGGGLCRFPDPPAMSWRDAQAAEIAARVAEFRKRWGEPSAEQMDDLVALTTKTRRPYRNRYAGLRRQIARSNGLHPIKDRVLID